MTDLTLLVEGREYRGWKSAQITLGIEQLASSFTMWIHETGLPDAWRIKKGAACVLKIGGLPVVTGYIDDRLPARDDKGYTVEIKGRSRPGDLVDCSAIHKSGTWYKRDVAQICADLCRPFGIEVVVDCPVGKPLPSFAIQQGETVFEAIDRATRIRGILPICNGAGNLVLTRAGVTVLATALDATANIEEARGTFSQAERYSTYIIKGQSPDEGESPTHATVLDPEILRYRPLIVHADQGDGATYKDRGVWERNVRRGRGSRYSATMTGWTHAAGIWLPNVLVKVVDAEFEIDEQLLIAQVGLTLDESGSRAELSLCRPEAYELIAKVKPTKKKGNPPW